MKKIRVLAALVLVWLPAAIFAAGLPSTNEIAGLLGKDVGAAQALLQTTAQPEVFAPEYGEKGSQLFIRTRGIRIFYSAEGKARTIRFDRPYAGTVGGIHIGDTLEKLKSTLGQPVREPQRFGMNQSYIYYPDDSYTARFDVTSKQVVESIFVFK